MTNNLVRPVQFRPFRCIFGQMLQVDEGNNIPKENIDPKKMPPLDEDAILEAMAAAIVAGISWYNFCDIPCHAHLLNKKCWVN